MYNRIVGLKTINKKSKNEFVLGSFKDRPSFKDNSLSVFSFFSSQFNNFAVGFCFFSTM